MKLRATTILAAVILAMTTVFVMTNVSSAQTTQERRLETAAVYNEIPFDCMVPSYGTDVCEGSFRVPNNHTVRVNYVRGAYGADFLLYYTSNGKYITKEGIAPGTAENLWTNRTGYAKNVYVKVGALNTSRYRITGSFLVLY